MLGHVTNHNVAANLRVIEKLPVMDGCGELARVPQHGGERLVGHACLPDYAPPPRMALALTKVKASPPPIVTQVDESSSVIRRNILKLSGFGVQLCTLYKKRLGVTLT